ncbi:MAG: hypothetical protein ACRDD2_13055 [Sarcina sp.]
MKKILICGLATILSASMFISCGADNKTPETKPDTNTSEQTSGNVDSAKTIETVVNKIKEGGYIPMPLERSNDEIKELYFSNLGDIKFDDAIENFALLETGRSPGVGFALIMKAKSGKVEDAKKIAETVLTKKTGDVFYPDEKEIFSAAKVDVKGDYVSLLIFNDDVKEEALKAYNEIIK